MSEIIRRLERLSEQVRQVTEERKVLVLKLEEMKRSIEALESENARMKETLEEKETLIHILQTAKSLNTKEESEEARKKVDDLVREIEHCLNLLDS
ncbi:MAG TPA: hypothetical protein P5550_09205 [Bacteroidales bacterium]|nr:hypothetical protein [Bacteroidales bacterium]HRZ76965.1 hypothetical protein [Bacteroidales bacterium]